MSEKFEIFVDDTAIYSGNFSEVPEHFRSNIIETLTEWGTVIGKRGLNEMIYSLFTWYDEVGKMCNNCSRTYTEGEFCLNCNSELIHTFRYERNENLSKLLTCVGMITHLKIL